LPSKKSGVRYGGFFSVRCETNSSTVAYTSKLDNMCPHDLITYKVLQQSSYKYIVSQTSHILVDTYQWWCSRTIQMTNQ
jgi:hypothetical protein